MRGPDRQPFNRPVGRPAPRRQRAPGPTTIAPSEPESPAHRRHLLKATYHRLARLSGVGCAELKQASSDRLLSIAANVAPAEQGDARLLAMKVLRLRG